MDELQRTFTAERFCLLSTTLCELAKPPYLLHLMAKADTLTRQLHETLQSPQCKAALSAQDLSNMITSIGRLADKELLRPWMKYRLKEISKLKDQMLLNKDDLSASVVEVSSKHNTLFYRQREKNQHHEGKESPNKKSDNCFNFNVTTLSFL